MQGTDISKHGNDNWRKNAYCSQLFVPMPARDLKPTFIGNVRH